MATPADTAARRLAREMLGWNSIELRVHEKINSTMTVDYHYIETRDGQRFYDIYAIDASANNTHETAWCDGKDCAYVACYPTKKEPIKQKNAIYSNIFMHEKDGGATSRAVPWRYFFANRVPLYDALPKSEYIGGTLCLGRDCDAFLFRQLLFAYVRCEVVYHLDKETAVPLKIEIFDDQNALAAKRLSCEWNALSLDEVQGFHMPMSSEFKTYLGPRGGPKKLVATAKTVVEALKYNADYPKSTFWPSGFDPGVEVLEGRTKPIKFYTIPGGEARQTEVKSPVQAVPPSNWSGTIAWAALLFGIALLGAGFVRRFKSRNR